MTTQLNSITKAFAAVTLAATLVLAACGKTSGEKSADIANDKMAQMSQVMSQLADKGIVVSKEEHRDSTREVPISHNINELLEIRAMLTQVISLAEDILTAASRGDVDVQHRERLADIQNSMTDAQDWKVKIEKRMNDIRRGSASAATSETAK